MYKIDSYPFQLRVARQEAILAGINAKVAQLDAQLSAAQATTRVARSNLLPSESDFDRQVRISLERAEERIEQLQAQLTLAEANFQRSQSLPSGTLSQQELDTLSTELSKFQAELAQVQTDKQSAQELITSGSNRLQAARDELQRAEVAELQAQIARDAEIDGEYTEIKQLTADLDLQRWELDLTVVRVPTDGYATCIALRFCSIMKMTSVALACPLVPKRASPSTKRIFMPNLLLASSYYESKAGRIMRSSWRILTHSIDGWTAGFGITQTEC